MFVAWKKFEIFRCFLEQYTVVVLSSLQCREKIGDTCADICALWAETIPHDSEEKLSFENLQKTDLRLRVAGYLWLVNL